MRLILAFSVVVVLASCGYESYNQREVEGQWFSNSWESNGEETGMRAWIAFDSDSTYRAIFNENREQGTYWIDGYKLFTKADGAEAIVVKIKDLDDNLLILDMNRSGNKETLLFTRGTVHTVPGSGEE